MQDRRRHRTLADYEEVCGVCGQRHIKIGDEIRFDPSTKRWASPCCLSRRDSPEAIEKKVQKAMLEKHNIHLGEWGMPVGATLTSSYAEFFKKALSLGVCTPHEFNTLREKLGDDIWYRNMDKEH